MDQISHTTGTHSINTAMLSPKEFLEEFTRDLIRHTGDRPAIIAGWAKHLEAREESIRQDAAIENNSTVAGEDSEITHNEKA